MSLVGLILLIHEALDPMLEKLVDKNPSKFFFSEGKSGLGDGTI